MPQNLGIPKQNETWRKRTTKPAMCTKPDSYDFIILIVTVVHQYHPPPLSFQMCWANIKLWTKEGCSVTGRVATARRALVPVVPRKAVAEVSKIKNLYIYIYIGEVGCCESRMAERSHWWIEKWLMSPLFLWLSTYLPNYLPPSLPTYRSIYLSIYLTIYLPISLSLSLSSVYPTIYLSIYLPTYLPTYLILPT